MIARSLLLAVVALASTGCGAAQTSSTAPSPLTVLTAERDIDGTVVGEAAAGTQATVVVVFASWCGHCRRELAILGEISRQQPAVRMIGLNAYEQWGNRSDEQRLRQFLGEYAPWLQVVRARENLLGAFGGATKIPTLFVFDREGRLVREFRPTRRRPPGREELLRVLKEET